MKSFNLLFILSILFFFSESCMQAQETSFAFDHPSTPVFLDYTSTGCPSCGRWGRPNAEALLNIHGNRVNHVAVHIRFNDPMESALTETLGQNRPGRKFTPQFWINGQQATYLNPQGYLDSAKTYDNAAAMIMNSYDKTNVPALDGQITESDSELKIDYGVRFYEDSDMNADYFIGCYLMQDGIRTNQKGAEPESVIHNDVLTKSANEIYGTKIDMNTVGVRSFSANFDTSQLVGEKAYAMLILWKKNGMQYEAVNSLRIE